MLQKVFDEEFKNELEEMRAKRKEKQRKAAQQLGLQRRRMLMEKTLQEEQDELARNHQVAMMIELIKDNLVSQSLRMEVNSVSARSLAKSLWVNDVVICLDLSANDLNDHAGTYLARVLKKNATLRKLELDNNNLGPKTCAALGESLLINTSLSYLSLDSNPLVTEFDINGFRSLVESLKTNTTLTSLNLWRTGINEFTGKIIADALETNETMLLCDVGHNSIEIGDLQRIINILDRNLADYEKSERLRRHSEAVEDENRRKLQEIKDVIFH